MTAPSRYSLDEYFGESPPPVFQLTAAAQFSPLDINIDEQWITGPEAIAFFLGMLTAARGWDPSHNIPSNIRQSLEEAHRSLEAANYRSTVVMARRTLEAVLKFGFQRLLGRDPVDGRGRALMLNDMITQFRKDAAGHIPHHLLHIADSVRLVGNVPGAHAAEIANYQFTRSDAEYALYAVSHFLHEYFNKIDTESTEYYTLTIDLNETQHGGETATQQADAADRPPAGR